MSKLLRNGIPRTEDGKIDFSWKNHYGFTGFIVLCGFLFPPLAVAVRFGIGKDFFINVLLTICGIIPGHIHNWFIQNVRNNDTKARTPKWAIRYGLVDDRPAKKLAKSRAWTGRFYDRVAQRVVYDDEGNAHVVEEEVETREDGVTAPWNVHGAVRENRTGLVEPDQWINQDASQSSFDYAHQQHNEGKPSKLARFRRSRHNGSSSAHDPHALAGSSSARRDSLASTTSSLSVVTPEDPTRFSPYAEKASETHQPTAHTNSSTASSTPNNYTTRRYQDDIFNHEF
ncbi:hypothetical protein EX895_005843 [Sporisorium graminicola]|uniref:Plasma membrane proteolipid 3 n=1 Tax=Sporisorium graminicola TaxID=280036 RepID=A0A4U7KLD9_9BASI|nr:hypothetical protein EX895_005843 [Sporisorium graminicola]TKY84763.1 hypothetical protein EX895_005843 [Sporisorium graminicola]